MDDTFEFLFAGVDDFVTCDYFDSLNCELGKICGHGGCIEVFLSIQGALFCVASMIE